MLQEIAAADYGYDEQKHYEALRQIRNTGVLSSPLAWHPKEVLELVRWSKPEDPEWKPGGFGERGHLMRAFCCAVLLEAAADPETYLYITSENETIVQLTASVLTLGREPSAAALHLLWRRILSLPEEDEERPFFALAILLLCASQYELVNDEQVPKTAEWVMREEADGRAKKADDPYYDESQWLLGLTNFNQKHDTWRRLAREILLDLPRPNAETAAILQDIGRRIVNAPMGGDFVG